MKHNIKITILLIFIFNISSQQCTAQLEEKNQFNLISWNVENLFDIYDDPNKIDEEYLPSAEREWTEERFNTKLKNLAHVIKNISDGTSPDIIGLQEIENREVLEIFVNKYLNFKNYKIAHVDSPDARGIDNALIYNSKLFEIISVEGLKIDLPGGGNTRDILFVKLEDANKNIFHFFVNHWPSRREGLKKSEPNRMRAAEVLHEKVKQLMENDPFSNIIILGDFNDMPSNISISEILGAEKFNCGEILPESGSNLFNLSYELFQKGIGSYKYRDHWNMLDQIIISRNLITGNKVIFECGSFNVLKPAEMVTRSGKYKDTPFPTYGGKRYLGGYSDHFPVGAKFNLN